MSTEDKPVLISLDYHSTVHCDDEVITHHDVALTSCEMRALMVWLSRQTPGRVASENTMSAVNRLYWMFSGASQAIDEEHDRLHPLRNPS